MKVFKFNWKDENGNYAGWNDVYANSRKEAIAKAKEMESPAKDLTHGVIFPDGTKGTSTERFTGMFLDESTLKEVSVEQHFENHRIADMMSR
jgi:hypothetical protein